MGRRLQQLQRRLRCRRVALASFILISCAPANAAWQHSVTWAGAVPASTHLVDGVYSAFGAALGMWTRFIAGGADIEVELELDLAGKVPRAAGNSVASGFVRHDGTYAIFEQGLAFEIRTGTDPNGSEPDVRIMLNPGYLEDELWFDPEPLMRTAQVPLDRTDAVSVFAHELGHAFGFNGWWDEPNGRLPQDYASTWDRSTAYDGAGHYFIGPEASALYGGPVPITLGNNWHVGNGTGLGADLLDDLMNGVAFYRGTRYEVSPLDLAMLDDMGVTLAFVPEPRTWALVFLGLGMMVVTARRSSTRSTALRSDARVD